jgi:uncharacterized membrane protein required for colicin V production
VIKDFLKNTGNWGLAEMNNAVILDGLVIVILIASAVSGAKRGLLMSLSRLVGLAAGIFGGKIAVDAFSPIISRRFVFPLVDEAVHSVLAATPDVKMVHDAQNALHSARELLTKVLEQLGLATVSLSKIADDIAGELMAGSGDIAAVISRRLSEILVFIVAFFVIQAVAHLILRALDEVLRLPVIGLPNRVGGAMLGFAKGMVMVVLLLWAGLTFLDSQTQNGGLLSPEIIRQTVISHHFVDWIARVLP